MRLILRICITQSCCVFAIYTSYILYIYILPIRINQSYPCICIFKLYDVDINAYIYCGKMLSYFLYNILSLNQWKSEDENIYVI